MNVNDPNVDVTLENGSGSCVDVILRKGIDPGVDMNRTGWILPYLDFPHYHPSFLDYLSPFSDAYLLPQTSNLSPVYITALALDPFHQIACALRHLTLFDEFDLTPPHSRSLYSRLFCLLSRHVDS